MSKPSSRRRKHSSGASVRQLTFDFRSAATPEQSAESAPEQPSPPTPRISPEAWRDPSCAPKHLSITEASYLIQVPVATLYKWHAAGKLKGVAARIGKQLRIDRDALLHLWSNGTQAPD